MNMQLRQCYTRIKPFRLKKKSEKAYFCLFFDFQKKPKVFRNAESAATLISNSAYSLLLIHIQAFYITS